MGGSTSKNEVPNANPVASSSNEVAQQPPVAQQPSLTDSLLGWLNNKKPNNGQLGQLGQLGQPLNKGGSRKKPRKHPKKRYSHNKSTKKPRK